MLNISNNKRRSLLKSEIIINFDFPEEIINQFKIYDNAILVNIDDKIDIKSKRFNGININYYKIQIPDEYIIKGFSDQIIYESLVYGINKYEIICKKIEEDKIEFKGMIGKNGLIKEKELEKYIDKNNIKE